MKYSRYFKIISFILTICFAIGLVVYTIDLANFIKKMVSDNIEPKTFEIILYFVKYFAFLCLGPAVIVAFFAMSGFSKKSVEYDNVLEMRKHGNNLHGKVIKLNESIIDNDVEITPKTYGIIESVDGLSIIALFVVNDVEHAVALEASEFEFIDD